MESPDEGRVMEGRQSKERKYGSGQPAALGYMRCETINESRGPGQSKECEEISRSAADELCPLRSFPLLLFNGISLWSP